MRNTNRIIKLNIEPGDAVDFIHILEDMIDRLADKYKVDEIGLIKIKNWFDHKWLKYSGKGIIHWEQTLHPDKVALTDFHKDKITVPPFNPNRVLSETFFTKTKSENKKFDNPLHSKQWSSNNLNNRISSKTINGLFIWFSSNTIANQQGSIMIYYVDKENVQTWYLSVENKSGWTITKVKGTNADHLKELIT